MYRVFAKGRCKVGPSKSLIFGTFPDVLGFFTVQYRRFFILILLGHMIKENQLEKLKAARSA